MVWGYSCIQKYMTNTTLPAVSNGTIQKTIGLSSST
jgi:hypothetical protein